MLTTYGLSISIFPQNQDYIVYIIFPRLYFKAWQMFLLADCKFGWVWRFFVKSISTNIFKITTTLIALSITFFGADLIWGSGLGLSCALFFCQLSDFITTREVEFNQLKILFSRIGFSNWTWYWPPVSALFSLILKILPWNDLFPRNASKALLMPSPF